MTNLPMVLSNIRVHGIGDVIDTKWFAVGGGLTNFLLPKDFNRQGFLHALQTINPPYDCHKVQPFNDYPRIYRQGKYQKRVRPHRRTIAFAIFAAQPDLVLRLSKITPHLYETDMIEVGRRMDHSRWVNFVEIASSTRWSEVKVQIGKVVADSPEDIDEQLKENIALLSNTDRIKDELREALDSWLDNLLARASHEVQKKELENLRFFVQRQNHFNKAKKVVKNLLPTFYIIDGENFTQSNHDIHQHLVLDSIKAQVNNILSNEMNTEKTKPVLLLDGPSLSLERNSQKKLLSNLEQLTGKCHCFYLQNEDDAVESAADKVVTLGDMLTKKRVAK